ncbi:ComF family protein [Candidatus Uhrbacteria bacterium]|nr:ComF family protein [Candidatus Uhrbacteria bacterium]
MKRILYNTIRKLSTGVLDFLFPVECMGCGSGEDWLCTTCVASIPRAMRLSCFTCKNPTTDGEWCGACRKESPLRGIWPAARYHAELLQRAIHAMKYSAQYVFAAPLAKFLHQFFLQWPFLLSARILFIPVPLHQKRLRERGYNQSHLLVAHLLSRTGSGVCGCWLLERTRHTKAQVQCAREERLRNVTSAFRYRGPPIAASERIVLVDDVATTGSTLASCARVLHTAGARDVWGLVLAR